ncbi:unnamed protein product, partial [Amoebophrya sp. A25]
WIYDAACGTWVRVRKQLGEVHPGTAGPGGEAEASFSRQESTSSSWQGDAASAKQVHLTGSGAAPSDRSVVEGSSERGDEAE